MNDIDKLKILDLEKRLQFSTCKIQELKEEVARLKKLLNGEDVLNNSLPVRKHCEEEFDKLKSSSIKSSRGV